MAMTHGAGVGPHLVHPYDDDAGLAARVAQFLAAGFYGGDALIVIARRGRVADFALALHGEGVDVDAARADGSVVVLDADELLVAIMVAGRPDPERFARVFSAPLRAAGRGRPGVRVYGEMVSLLWERGDVSAALAVEELWNVLAAELSFVLYCAYPLAAVEPPGQAPESHAALEAVCRLHSGAICGDGRIVHASAYAHFERTAPAPGASRRFASRMLAGAEDGALVDLAALVISELATNAIAHGGSPFTATVSRLPDSVRLSVRDDSPSMPVPRVPGAAQPGGRGLVIVAALSRRWGTVARPGGKVVWAELERTRTGAPAAGCSHA